MDEHYYPISFPKNNQRICQAPRPLLAGVADLPRWHRPLGPVTTSPGPDVEDGGRTLLKGWEESVDNGLGILLFFLILSFHNVQQTYYQSVSYFDYLYTYYIYIILLPPYCIHWFEHCWETQMPKCIHSRQTKCELTMENGLVFEFDLLCYKVLPQSSDAVSPSSPFKSIEIGLFLLPTVLKVSFIQPFWWQQLSVSNTTSNDGSMTLIHWTV